MSYLVLARKWRPQRFAEVIGQRQVSLTLSNALKTGRLSHAYLFAGPRGVGKTSVARILAKALNCEQGPAAEPCNACAACAAITEGHCLDVLEIDGASNRGIDDVRQLRESVKYAPASVRTKVYIIDEVHMLTTDAFNALLKTLEEPPQHVCFVMATTEPLKVPATILSRCQRFDFGRVPAADLQEHLQRIAAAESLAIDAEALLVLARKAEGGVRDGLTLLDQVAATGEGPFDAARVQDILGLSGGALCFEISEAVVARDPQRALLRLQEAYQSGLNLQEVAEELVQHFRSLLLMTFGEKLAAAVELTSDERARLTEQIRAHGVGPADALRLVRILLDVTGRMRRSGHARVHLEVALAEMATLARAVDLGEVLARLRAGEDAPAKGPSGLGGGEAGETPGPGPRGRSAAGAVREAGGVAATAPAPSGGEWGDAWAQVVARVRAEKAFLGSCLHTSQVAGLADGRLLIVLNDANGFMGDQVEQAVNRRVIMQAIEAAFGRPLGFRVVKARPAPEAEPARAAPAPAGRADDPAGGSAGGPVADAAASATADGRRHPRASHAPRGACVAPRRVSSSSSRSGFERARARQLGYASGKTARRTSFPTSCRRAARNTSSGLRYPS